MKIYKQAQQDEGMKKGKIVFDFEKGTASFVWADGQWPEGAPCVELLKGLFDDMVGVESSQIDTSQHSDPDISREPPIDRQQDYSMQEDFVIEPKKQL